VAPLKAANEGAQLAQHLSSGLPNAARERENCLMRQKLKTCHGQASRVSPHPLAVGLDDWLVLRLACELVLGFKGEI